MVYDLGRSLLVQVSKSSPMKACRSENRTMSSYTCIIWTSPMVFLQIHKKNVVFEIPRKKKKSLTALSLLGAIVSLISWSSSVKMPSVFHSVEKMRLTHLILFWFIFPSVIKCLSKRTCPPTLTDTFQNQIVICTTNSHSNRRNSLYIDVEFEAFPKPNVTWILNKHVGQEKVIYPGDRSRGYRSFQLRQDVRKSLFSWICLHYAFVRFWILPGWH